VRGAATYLQQQRQPDCDRTYVDMGNDLKPHITTLLAEMRVERPILTS
jgi:hypothetical protein